MTIYTSVCSLSVFRMSGLPNVNLAIYNTYRKTFTSVKFMMYIAIICLQVVCVSYVDRNYGHSKEEEFKTDTDWQWVVCGLIRKYYTSASIMAAGLLMRAMELWCFRNCRLIPSSFSEWGILLWSESTALVTYLCKQPAHKEYIWKSLSWLAITGWESLHEWTPCCSTQNDNVVMFLFIIDS